ncbi:uracil-DNA glycosylase family protein [Cohaesibacter sp. CAU 1516]|uniref:uracil-DNA glycosylase family protein n=1 Tax=Cohaesibacter sp. CAU 1516 TaxID=2576038 RepID=UPI0010FD93EA|nr:uracil-DNA glycosylase family protein [Cohaesibacter sp. CAU 1516]TLP43339.1 uracil-DNA glycosylase family protein [Cohaesibacter sp. CAU 1516]
MRDAESTIHTLNEQIAACRLCRDSPTGRALPHEPRPVVRLSATARICIAGQAPGNLVHQTGTPFNDPSGDRLRDWMGVDREVFYDQSRIAIVPMGFCFPGNDAKGGDLPPRKECQTQWHDQIFRAMPQVSLVLVIGQYAQRYHLGDRREANLTETVRKALTYWQEDTVPNYLPLPHPSWRNTGWLKRNPWFEAEILPVLRAEVAKFLS